MPVSIPRSDTSDSAVAGATVATRELTAILVEKGPSWRCGTLLMPGLPITLIALLFTVAIFAPWIAPHSPYKGGLRYRLTPPAWMEGGSIAHPLGTDRLGRDLLSRIIHGSRFSLSVSLIAILLSGSVGTVIGLVSGYKGGWVDAFLMRLVDVFLSLPPLLVAIVMAVTLGPSFRNVVAVLSILLWLRYARQIRGETLSVREQDFVALARVAGASGSRILFLHIFPNVLPSLLVLLTWQVGFVIILEATLSFLGVGIPPPHPSWGLIVAESRDLIAKAWWLPLFPGVAILLTVFSFNLLGDWLRDRLDPMLQNL